MAKSELKTRETDASIEEFLNGVADEGQRSNSFKVLEIFTRLSGEEPKIWGPAIVGFGSRTVTSSSGRDRLNDHGFCTSQS